MGLGLGISIYMGFQLADYVGLLSLFALWDKVWKHPHKSMSSSELAIPEFQCFFLLF